MKNTMIRWVLVACGTFFLIIGMIGIFIPILPTTPFLLLAAACYARGSEKFYSWLINNRWLGNYIKNYQEGRGIPLSVKMATIALLWISILFSAIIIVTDYVITIILLVIAAGVTIHILTLKTLDKGVNNRIK
jgi:hypothetical protein